MMKILAPYVKMNPKTAESLRAFAPTAEWVDTSATAFSYWWMISNNWNKGESIVVIEQDIEITADVIPSFEACPLPWCVYEYPGRADAIFSGALGCTKFSAAAQATCDLNNPKDVYSPDLCTASAGSQWAEVPGGRTGISWIYLDSFVNGAMRSHGNSVHVHGSVKHHHDYAEHPNAGSQ